MGKAINKKALIGILLFCFGANPNNMTLGIMAYIMRSYADVSQTVVQTIMVAPSLVGMIYAFCVGNINQKIPAKKLAIFGQSMIFLMGMIFMFLGGRVSIYILIVAAGLVGFMQGAVNTLLGLLLLDVVPDEKQRSTLLGICMAVMNIGGVFFTTVGGIIAVGHWQNAYILYFYMLAAIILEIFLLPNAKPEGIAQSHTDSEEKPDGKSNGKGMGKVWILSVHYLFFYMFLYVYGTNVSEYIINTYQLGTSVEAGIATSCVTVGGVCAGAFFGLYSTRFLKKFTVPALMGVTVIGLGIPAFLTPGLVKTYISGILLGFSMFGCGPYILTRLHNMVPKTQYGKAMSIYSGFTSAGMLIAIYVLTFLTQLVCGDGTNIHYKFMVASAGALVCFITSFPIYLSKDKAGTDN